MFYVVRKITGNKYQEFKFNNLIILTEFNNGEFK